MSEMRIALVFCRELLSKQHVFFIQQSGKHPGHGEGKRIFALIFLRLPGINAQGFLLSFQLFTLVRKGTSLETNKTFKPTNSDAQDVDVSEQAARLSFVDTLACDLRPSPDAATLRSQAREAGGIPALGRLLVLRSHGPLKFYSTRGTQKRKRTDVPVHFYSSLA